jgi:hypothetical protein
MIFLVDGVSVPLLIDSGASCNLMSEKEFCRVSQQAELKLKPCTRNVYAYGATEPLPVMGCCSVNIKVPETGMTVSDEIIIVQGSPISLLGRNTCQKLDVLRVGAPASAYSIASSRKSAIVNKYPKVFQGLGKLKDYQLKLHIRDDAIPVAQHHRRIPFSRRDQVAKKLEELERLDVIEKVSEPSAWVNPLVTVQKPNGDVRMCLDMREANKAIIRERYPIPTVEETLQEISGGKVFSKLDLNMGYHQIELEPQSRNITTFAGPDSLYRYKRLIFGVNMATEKFQHIIGQVIHGCPGANNISDDIILVGSDDADHDTKLDTVLQRIEENNITLNPEKCLFGVTQLDYMGHTLTNQGLKVSDAKVEAVREAPQTS